MKLPIPEFTAKRGLMFYILAIPGVYCAMSAKYAVDDKWDGMKRELLGTIGFLYMAFIILASIYIVTSVILLSIEMSRQKK